MPTQMNLFEILLRPLTYEEIDDNFKVVAQVKDNQDAALAAATAAQISASTATQKATEAATSATAAAGSATTATAKATEAAASAVTATNQASSAATSATQAAVSSAAASVSAIAAVESAEQARAIVGVPPAFDSLIMQPNRIDVDMTVPDGFNAVMFGDFELGPDATITCLGNANFVAIG